MLLRTIGIVVVVLYGTDAVSIGAERFGACAEGGNRLAGIERLIGHAPTRRWETASR